MRTSLKAERPFALRSVRRIRSAGATLLCVLGVAYTLSLVLLTVFVALGTVGLGLGLW